MNVTFDQNVWRGRSDTQEPGDTRRVFNQIVPLVKGQQIDDAAVIIGFCSDEGVRRNQGRVGAAHGPKQLRAALAGLPAKASSTVFDAGDVVCDDGSLEAAQADLARVISEVLACGGRPIVFGGGHEVAWGTYSGLREHLGGTGERRLMILNFDAHFDLRQSRPASSGTPFDQIACDCAARGLPFDYVCLGVSDLANTAALFERARELGVRYVLDTDMQESQLAKRLDELERMIDAADDIYLTIDLDVLPGGAAPGVSAPAVLGVPLSVVEAMVRHVRASGKLRAADIAECNPAFDHDRRTALAAARLAHRLL
ncbi:MULTISPECIES: formimidoylglutamase [unclassified Caballeronia]|uniref:formimidoylglutamase n=1 Tax=unclassified Caballeronia TaxID=2646786 RepID=UPI002863A147|nr:MULTISPECIES: formimidoylglutamase [unclassified Caballeronia]MDR5752526.1 formimidoylglutamase [Caballeronia sp. LZ024]MDR5841682.1 formimidoylglutamase [Caballeronia sp. LZ031]